MARSRSARPRPTEDGILEAAERLFASRGFGAPSLRDLLAEAGVSTTAFYARFEDKDAVLSALVDQLFGELLERAAGALADARSMPEGFGRGVDVLVQTVLPRKGLVRVVLTEAATVPALRARLAAGMRSLAGLLAAQLAAARVPDAEPLGWALLGAVEGQVRRWAVSGDLDDDALDPALRAVSGALLTRLAG